MYDENGVPVGAYGNETPRRWFGKVAQGIIIVALVVAVLRLLIPAEKDDVVDNSGETVQTSSSSASEQYSSGETYFEAEDFSSAVYAYTQAINLGYSPIDRAYFERGRAEYRLKDYEAAIASYTRSLELSPECNECYVDYHNRGHAYWQLEKYDEAIADFNRAIEIKTDYLAAYVSRSKLREIQGDQSAALSSLDVGFDRAATQITERSLIAGQQRDLEIESGGEQYQFTFSAKRGERVTFSIPSASVDVVLLLRSPGSAAVAYDDSGDETGGDELTYHVEKTGHYTITVASYSPDAVGSFSLSMEKASTNSAAIDALMPEIVPDTLDQLVLSDTVDTESTLWQAFSRDGTTLAEYTLKELFLYDLTEDPVVKYPHSLEYGSVSSLALSTDGYKLAVGTPDRVFIYSTASMTLLTTIVTVDISPTAMVFSPDGSTLALTISNLVALYNADSGKRIGSLYLGANYGRSLDISRDGHWLVVGLNKGKVQIWNLEDRKPIRTMETGKIEAVLTVAFNPDASLIAAGGEARRVYVWERLSGDLLDTYTDHQRRIRSVTFSPDGTLLVSGSEDETVLVRDVNDPEESFSLLHQGKVMQVAFQADGNTLMTTSDDLKLQFWRVKE